MELKLPFLLFIVFLFNACNKDIRNEKYFFHGIANLDGKITQKVKKKYNVDIVNLNCILDSINLESNQRIDSISKTIDGISVSEFITLEMKKILEN